MGTKFDPEKQVEEIISRLSTAAKLSQLDLALATTLPRFHAVAEDQFTKLHRKKGTPQEILDILLNLEAFLVTDDQGNFSHHTAEKLLIENSFGAIWGLCQTGSPQQNHLAAKRLQEVSNHQGISKVPLLIVEEGLHGLLAKESTIFPQAIAIGAAFSPSLAEEIGFAIGQEANMRGANAVFSPVLDLALDARWGRCEETFGADPFLVAEMGAAMVRGLRRAGVAPIIKHFCGHGWVCGGRDSNDNALSIRELRRIHLIPFQKAIEAGALGVMSAYHALAGLPCTANPFLLSTILRDEWDFSGLTISDAGAVEDLHRKYRLVPDRRSAVEAAFQAGLDVHNNGPGFQEDLLSLVEEGKIKPDDLDRAAARVLYVKHQLGLLDQPQPDPTFDVNVWLALRQENRRLSKRAAINSLTLLKNTGNLLPLAPRPDQKVLVAGNLAGDRSALLGDYSLDDGEGPALLQELIAAAPAGTAIIHAPDLSLNALDCRQADLILVVVGERSGFRTGALSGEGCDRASVELPESQRALVQTAAYSGKPVALIVLAGRPLALEEENALVDAILYCYYPGEAGAAAIAEIIFGASSPQGNLPYDLPRRTGQVPIFYHQLPTGRSRDYCDLEGTPLYPFGYGLRYTTFELSKLRVEVIRKAPDPLVQVTLMVKNNGSQSSDALVQLYCKDLVSSVVTPEKRLVAFRKEPLKEGQKRSIQFDLEIDAFALLDINHNWIVEQGEFEIAASLSSGEELLSTIIAL